MVIPLLNVLLMCGILSLTVLFCLNLLQPSDIQLINCIFPIIVIIEFYVDVRTNSLMVLCCKLHVVSNIMSFFCFERLMLHCSAVSLPLSPASTPLVVPICSTFCLSPAFSLMFCACK